DRIYSAPLRAQLLAARELNFAAPRAPGWEAFQAPDQGRTRCAEGTGPGWPTTLNACAFRRAALLGSTRRVPHGPVAAPPTNATAHLPQHHVGDRLLLLAQRGVERLEHLGKGLHLCGALRHPLARQIQPVGQARRDCAFRTLLAALLAQ